MGKSAGRSGGVAITPEQRVDFVRDLDSACGAYIIARAEKKLGHVVCVMCGEPHVTCVDTFRSPSSHLYVAVACADCGHTMLFSGPADA